jgi:hypothetical protein
MYMLLQISISHAMVTLALEPDAMLIKVSQQPQKPLSGSIQSGVKYKSKF